MIVTYSVFVSDTVFLYSEYFRIFFGKPRRAAVGFSEFRRYSGRDRALIRELIQKFNDLPGRMISGETEEPD